MEIWKGIYNSFNEVPIKGSGFLSDWNADKAINRTIKAQETGARFQEYLLPAVVAMAYDSEESNEQPFIVFDVGGGAGNSFPAVRNALSNSVKLDYRVIDNYRVCSIGRDLYTDSSISFYENIPENKICNVMHVGSALQYIDDYKLFIQELANTKPRYFLFSDVFAGEIPTFVTGEHYFDSVIPFRFFNLSELVTLIEKMGYRLILKTEYDRTMVGQRDPLPLDSLPEIYRLKYSHHLLFKETCRWFVGVLKLIVKKISLWRSEIF